jgi:multiple sugar transport system permease protein
VLDAVKVPEAPPDEEAPPSKPRRPRRELLPYFLLVPAVLLELLIHIVPMLAGVGISFLKLTQYFLNNWRHAPFAGFSNYKLAVNINQPAGKALLHSFEVTLWYTLIVLTLSWLIGMAAAVLTQRPFFGRSLVRTVFLIPFALPVFTSVITWSFMAQRDNGLINHVLVNQLHLLNHRPFWLIGPNSFITLCAVTVWRTWPFAFLCITAGMQSIPTELYEAATIDGAGVFGQIRRVTLPLLGPVNRVLILVVFLWTFNDFTTPYTLFGKSAPYQADLISIHIYQNSFGTWNFGTGSAMSVLLLLFLLVVTAAYLLVVNRRTENA